MKKYIYNKVCRIAGIGFVTLLLQGVALPAAAQQLDAKEVLQRTQAHFEKAGGMEVGFVIRMPQAASRGTIRLKGEKFVLDTEGVKTWFDGRTQWSYLVNSEEVNVSEPTQEELLNMNPYVFLSLDKHGYKLSSGIASADAYRLVFTATDSRAQLQQLELWVKKSNFQPQRITMQPRDEQELTITVTSCKEGQTYADGFFRFDAKKYPQAEIIDLR